MDNEKSGLTETEQLFCEYIANALCIKDLSEILPEYVPTMCTAKENAGESNDEVEVLYNAIMAVRLSLEKRNETLLNELCNTKSLIHREIYELRHHFYTVDTQSEFGILPMNRNMVKDYDEANILQSLPHMEFKSMMDSYLTQGIDQYRELMARFKSIDEKSNKKNRFKVIK